MAASGQSQRLSDAPSGILVSLVMVLPLPDVRWMDQALLFRVLLQSAQDIRVTTPLKLKMVLSQVCRLSVRWMSGMASTAFHPVADLYPGILLGR